MNLSISAYDTTASIYITTHNMISPLACTRPKFPFYAVSTHCRTSASVNQQQLSGTIYATVYFHFTFSSIAIHSLWP